MPTLAFMSLGGPEMLVVGIVAVILFGSRLPSIARSMGRSLTEFKKGMEGVTDGVKDAMYAEPDGMIDQASHYDDQQAEPSSPAFEPPAAEEPGSKPDAP